MLKAVRKSEFWAPVTSARTTITSARTGVATPSPRRKRPTRLTEPRVVAPRALCGSWVAVTAAAVIFSSLTPSRASVGDGLAARHDRHPVAEALELERVGGADQDRAAVGGELAQQAVDLDPGADVDPLGRLVADQHLRPPQHRPREGDLLLVAAGKGGDVGLRARRS